MTLLHSVSPRGRLQPHTRLERQWTKAGGAVATTGGKAIVRAKGAGNVFVRDVNGLMWELIQRAAH